MGLSARVITVSDRTARGEREDRSGPVAVTALRDAGFSAVDAVVIPDGADTVEAALREALAAGIRLIVTTGGTGISPRDRTPEGTARVLDRELPGIAEELRRRDTLEKPHGMLTRGLVGTASTALIVNLPGSPAAVAVGMPVVLSVATHVLDQLDGGDH
ncbi:MogA/MoaB family molybdenum cofactor biosynthesis protein [Microbacterium invictum]|uniref:Molybdenum cofactor synthesis domain-containing protein n=1 Tax=Microbacterium invictum TaxID=515415 RepID=A0AA40VL96_9MICO|nr:MULTISPECIES: MogA/MoaB family molybdenum cofactor biosynthesis protein [Microbacterium]MBB4138364.1 molybdenum cofactor synthesis domain-containing protein [Microbacterium invictum]